MGWCLDVLFIAFGYTVSLLVFQRGLLVKRQVISSRSTCADVILPKSTSCWLPARYNRSIWVVVDALRYDFIEPVNNENWSRVSGDTYYRGQMPLTSQFLRETTTNHSAHLFRFISDAPTTTFQRIKALTTGNIPAFIEAGENFGASEINEDNFIDQLISVGKNVTFLGDDTWTQLLPNRFHREFAVPSFDIKDLDLVDNFVIKQIFDEIERPDWNLLVAHVLGVDHCGHRYGPNHPEMRRKLRQMDELIFNITEIMPDDAILAVMGDHGMTSAGDHGGESRAETEAALFLYSKDKKLIFTPEMKDKNEINQIDLIPTISLLLGIPIPFSNIGLLIEQLFHPEQVGTALKLNAIQVLRYAQEYAQTEPHLQLLLWPIVQNFETAVSDQDRDLNYETILKTQKALRVSFQTSDFSIALVGILSLLETILFNIYVIIGTTSIESKFQSISMAQYIFRSALHFLQLSLYLGSDNQFLLSKSGERRTDLLIFSVLTVLASLLYTSVLLFVHLISGFFSFRHYSQIFGIGNLILSGFIILQSFSFLSNSYIIDEACVLRFLLQTFLFYTLFKYFIQNRLALSNSVFKKKRKFRSRSRIVSKFSIIKIFRSIFWRTGNIIGALKIILCLILVRCTQMFEICREEQVQCTITSFFNDKKNIANIGQSDAKRKLRVLLSIFCVFALNFFLNRKNRSDLLELESFQAKSLSSQKSSFARISLKYSTTVIRLTSALSWPMCLGVTFHWLCEFIASYLAENLNAVTAEVSEEKLNAAHNLIELFGVGSQRSAQFVYVLACGLIFVSLLAFRSTDFHSTFFKNNRVLTSILLSMILGERLALALCIVVVVFTIMEDFFHPQVVLIIQLLDVFSSAVFKYLLGALAFYTFGHQCTLVSIPWEAAFVGIPGNFWLKPMAGLMVFVHLFGGNFLAIVNVFCGRKGNFEEMDRSRKAHRGFQSEILIFLTLNAIRVFASTISAVVLQKNLMFFKIFAPKFVFEAANLLFCCSITIFYGLSCKIG